VLTRNPDAVQIGLTATPRQLKIAEGSWEAEADFQLTQDNLRYFGEPVYEYDMSQGIEDGYLAACEVHRFDLFHDNKAVNERESGVTRKDLVDKHVTDATTGKPLAIIEVPRDYAAHDIEDKILMPERVEAMTRHLFERLLQTGGPEQKTIIFCARDRHADDAAAAMNNLYADWCARTGHPRAEPYAFKCTASVGGAEYIADLRGATRRHFVATTVDLLTTGVDVPVVRNIVFFKYVRSPSPSTRCSGAAPGLTLRPGSSCSACGTTPTRPGCSERRSSAGPRRRGSRARDWLRSLRNVRSWWRASTCG